MTPGSGLWVLAGLVVAVCLAAIGSARAARHEPARDAGSTPVRIAYTASVFRDIHENDAKASIKVWSESTAKEMDINAYSEVEVVPDVASLADLLETERVDFGGSSMFEFLQIENRIDADPVLAVMRGGTYSVEYVLLVRRERAWGSPADLKGAHLKLFDNPRTCLAIPWLESCLAERGGGSAVEVFGRITEATKLSGVILPVFFGRADACLVTRDGFLTMAELNPQVGSELRVLAESPSVIPMVSFFRRGFAPHFREEMIQAICKLHTSATGRQILNLMQGDSVVVLAPGALTGTRDLMRRWTDRTAASSGRSVPQDGRAGPARSAQGGLR